MESLNTKASADFITNYNRLKSQQLSLEKLCQGMLPLIKNIVNPEIFNQQQHLEHFRRENSKNIEQHLIWIILTRRKLKNDVMDKNKLRELDVSYFKNTILELEKKISMLKGCSAMEIDRLRTDETLLNLDIDRLEANINSYDCKKFNYISSKIGRSVSAQGESKEVSEYLHFLYNTGGHEGGWRSDDHMLFLKYVKKYENNEELLLTELSMLLPEISLNAIKFHLEWFKNYTTKKNIYKQAAIEWRNKQKERASSVVKVSSAPIVRVTKKGARNLETTKQKLIEWKTEKMKKLSEERERLLIESQRLRCQEDTLNSKRYVIKEKVEMWKLDKISVETSKKEQMEFEKEKEKEMKVLQAHRLIKEFQSQDKLFIERRREVNSEKIRTATVRSRSLTLAHVQRDPERVFKATKQWIEKTKPQPKIQTMPLSLNNVPKLAKPAWLSKLPML